ncbi:MAG: hypothetical protein QOI86_2120 [Actinomycetota bacterium]|nr:hypothetical protein [Actinomycetota bacterium]
MAPYAVDPLLPAPKPHHPRGHQRKNGPSAAAKRHSPTISDSRPLSFARQFLRVMAQMMLAPGACRHRRDQAARAELDLRVRAPNRELSGSAAPATPKHEGGEPDPGKPENDQGDGGSSWPFTRGAVGPRHRDQSGATTGEEGPDQERGDNRRHSSDPVPSHRHRLPGGSPNARRIGTFFASEGPSRKRQRQPRP